MLLPVGDNIQKKGIPFVAIALIAVNVLIFLIQQSHGIGEEPEIAMEMEYEFVMKYGLVPAELGEGQVLGLITHMFMHGGFMHLLGNMVVLWAFAPALEFGMGRWSFLGFYGLFGLAGGAAHAFSNIESEIPMVGASGAIAGLIGAYTVIYGPMSKIKMMLIIFFRPFFFQIPALVFGIGWIVLQVLSVSDSPEQGGGVAWWAHIGGFAVGAVIAFVCRNETEAKLIDDGKGELRLVENQELADEIIKKVEAEQLLNPIGQDSLEPQFEAFSCPHCQGPFEKSDLISDLLVRCPQLDCQRLIYLSRELSTGDQLVAVPNNMNIAPGLGANPAGTSQPAQFS